MAQDLLVKYVEASLLECKEDGRRVVKSVLLEFGLDGDDVGVKSELSKKISIESARGLMEQLQKQLEFLELNPQLISNKQ